MYEDPRFPNRKRREPDPSPFGNQLPGASHQDPNGEITEDEQLPVSNYRVIETDTEPPTEKHAAPVQFHPIATPADKARETPASETPFPRLPPSKVWIERIQRFVQSPTRVYAAAGVGLGVLFGVVFAVVLWQLNHAEGRYDLESFTSSAAGLKGHLWIEWDKKVAYRLTIEPSDPNYKAGFAQAVARPLRPLSIQVHLEDSQGFVLCTRDIVLKYDARNAEALAASTTDSQALKTDAADQPAQASNYAQLDAQEATRERDHEIFQNQIGPDGQITAINAHGEFPCSKTAYEKTASWSFTPDFPSIAEQAQWLKRQRELQAAGAHPSSSSSAARKKKVAIQLLPYTIEGDDAIVDFDAGQGVIATRGRKTFFLDKASGAAADSAWQDYPVSIHYRCDQSSICTLTHSGLGSLQARMKR
jgi:hypothetical protein